MANLDECDRAEIVAWATRHSEIEQVWLIGSRARGDNRPDSDIDLALVMRPSAHNGEALLTWMDFPAECKGRAPRELSVSAEVHVVFSEVEAVADGIRRDGVLIYNARYVPRLTPAFPAVLQRGHAARSAPPL